MPSVFTPYTVIGSSLHRTERLFDNPSPWRLFQSGGAARTVHARMSKPPPSSAAKKPSTPAARTPSPSPQAAAAASGSLPEASSSSSTKVPTSAAQPSRPASARSASPRRSGSPRASVSVERGELVVNRKFKNIRSSLLLEAAAAGDSTACLKLIEAGIPLECKDVRPQPVPALAQQRTRTHRPQGHSSDPLVGCLPRSHTGVPHYSSHARTIGSRRPSCS